MIRLVALDIDGTLIHPRAPHDAMPADDMTQAVRDLVANGVVVVLASGRMFPGTASVARHLGLAGPVVCQQGASIHELDGRLRHAYSLERDIALELRAYADVAGWASAWFDARRYLVTRHTPESHHFVKVSGVQMEVHPAPESTDVIATGVDIISTPDHAGGIHAELSARYGDALSILDFSSVTAIHAPQASKGRAIEDLARELGIEASEVLAVGDSVNDVSMLEWAGESAAPGHCTDYARAAATEILAGEGVDGVVQRLRQVLEL